jgi:tetratricopeptide (TPR) repeat protein
VLHAAELDPYLAEAQHGIAGYQAWYEWDWESAEAAFIRSIELNPSYASARVFYSHFLTAMGRNDEGAVQIERALELDPLNSFYQALYAAQLVMAGQIDDAIEQFRQLYERDPGLGFGHGPFQDALFKKGLYAESFAEAKIKFTARGDHESLDALERGYAVGGITEAMRNVAEILEARSRNEYVTPIRIVFAYDVAGETEKAFAWLEKAFEGRDPNMVYLAVLPLSDEIRNDPRFIELLRRMKLPH